MNYNANSSQRSGHMGRKVKRVSDVGAMGYNPYDSSTPNVQQGIYPNLMTDSSGTNFQQGYTSAPAYTNTPFPNASPAPNPNTGYNYNVQTPQQQSSFHITQSTLGVLGQPVMQDMAMQYGQQLAGAGKTMIKQEVEKYVPVTKLKYYFAVDTKYVLSKLMLLFFPFTHSDWSIKYEQEGPVQPRFEINAPDLYIPTMAYITYILVAGLVLGMQEKFTPEQIGITASSALAWTILELLVYSCTLYIIQVETSLKTLDLLAFSGYKFFATIVSILISLVAGRMGFYLSLIYTNFALAFFLVRSLKVQVLAEKGSNTQGYYNPPTTSGHKRRLYFLLFVAGMQPVLSWWLSYHLVPTNALLST